MAATLAYPGQWRWTEDDECDCPGCGVRLRVAVTDDYEDDAIASLVVVEAAS